MSTSFRERFQQFGADIEQVKNNLAEVRDRLSRVERSSGDDSSGTRDTINVIDYGATGNGDVDDGPNIQDALIDASESAGRSRVRLPDGTYFIDGTVLIPSDVTLVGSGIGASTIQGALNNEPTLKFDDCENVRLEGLTYTAEAAPDNSHSWFFFGSGDNIRFHGCEWRDLPRQGGLFRGSDYLFTGCRIRNTGRDGLLFVGVDRPIVSNCQFYRTGDDSIAFNADTTNGVAIGNVVVESGFHHAGGGVKQHGSHCAIIGNVFVRPKTYAVRVQNRDEDTASTGPWPDGVLFNSNVVNGMNAVGGENNSAVEIKTINGEVSVRNCYINTYDGESANRRGMRIRATGPQTRVDVSNTTISQDEVANSKYGIVLENDFERIKINDVSFYGTSDAVLKRNASRPAGDAEIRDCYFAPVEEKQLLDCIDDDGFATLRIRGCTSTSPGSPLVDLNDAEFGLVQLNDNLARGHDSLITGTGGVGELVTGPL